jgi:hypothetical protein
MNNRGWIPSNEFMGYLSYLLIFLLIASWFWFFTQPFQCPSCNLECPPQKDCPSCVCNPPTIACPELKCPSVCELDNNSINKLAASFPKLSCLPNQLQQTALFSLVLAALSTLVAFTNRKSKVGGLISGVVYLGIILYISSIGFIDYALLGIIIFAAVFIASNFGKISKG